MSDEKELNSFEAEALKNIRLMNIKFQEEKEMRQGHRNREHNRELRNIESHLTYMQEVDRVREASLRQEKRDIERDKVYFKEVKHVQNHRKNAIAMYERIAIALEKIVDVLDK